MTALTPRCVSALAVDGGTRFRLPGNALRGGGEIVTGLGPEIAALQNLEAEDLEKGVVRDWPLEDGSTLGVRVQVWGPGRDRFRVDVDGCCEIRWSLQTGEVRMLARARDLYARGIRGWLERWIPNVSWWTRGVVGLPIDGRAKSHAYSEGWRTVGLELNCDYVDLSFSPEDADNWIGVRKVGRRGFQRGDARPGELEDDDGNAARRFDDVDSWGKMGAIETLAIGSRSNRVSVCIYNKARQIADMREGDFATYKHVWKAHGFEPPEDGAGRYQGPPIWRVELRLKGEALRLIPERETATGPEPQAIDLRNPATLCDRDALRRVWESMMRQRRLGVPLVGNDKRRVWPTDPRWVSVIYTDADPIADHGVEHLRQDRIGQQDHWDNATKRAALEAVRAALRHGALRDKLPETAHDLQMIIAGAMRVGLELTGARPGALTYADEYQRRQMAICGDEIKASDRDVAAGVEAMHKVLDDWSADHG